MHDMRQLREISARMARPCAITFLFRDALCFASLAWRARAMRLEGQVHLSGAHQWRKEDNKTELGPPAVRELKNVPCLFCYRRAREVPSMLVVVRIAALPAPCDARARQLDTHITAIASAQASALDPCSAIHVRQCFNPRRS